MFNRDEVKELKGLVNIINEELINKGENFRIQYQEVYKNNQKLFAFLIKEENNNISPTVYIKKADLSKTIEDWIDYLRRILMDNTLTHIDLSNMVSKEYILTHVKREIISNSNKEYIKNKMVVPLLDMVILFRVYIAEEASFIVTKDIVKACDITIDELMENSEDNYIIKNIFDLTNDFIDCEDLDILESIRNLPLLVVTNTKMRYGATVLSSQKTLDYILDVIAKDNYYIIPSSVHEILVIDSEYGDKYNMKNTILDVNKSMINQTDKLTDSLYSYDRKNGLQIVL